MTEHEVQKEILDYLKRIRLYHWRNNTGRRGTVSYGFLGSADILGILSNGRFLAVECKSDTGKQSDLQKEFQLNIEANNGLYILARSIEDVIKGLQTGEAIHNP